MTTLDSRSRRASGAGVRSPILQLDALPKGTLGHAQHR
jgi:hypothetical protein